MLSNRSVYTITMGRDDSRQIRNLFHPPLLKTGIATGVILKTSEPNAKNINKITLFSINILMKIGQIMTALPYICNLGFQQLSSHSNISSQVM